MRLIKRILFVVSPFVIILLLIYGVNWLLDKFGPMNVMYFFMLIVTTVLSIAGFFLIVQLAWEKSEKVFPKKTKRD